MRYLTMGSSTGVPMADMMKHAGCSEKFAKYHQLQEVPVHMSSRGSREKRRLTMTPQIDMWAARDTNEHGRGVTAYRDIGCELDRLKLRCSRGQCTCSVDMEKRIVGRAGAYSTNESR
jgi:hypothetical protein